MKRMDRQTLERLHSLNQQFYQTFGYEFASTRGRLQPGVKRILDSLTGAESILDLGCGNGELARELVRRGHAGGYTGVDFSPPLLEVAQRDQASPIMFVQADLLNEDWTQPVTDRTPPPFDWVTAFAVLHHIPGEAARLGLLQRSHELLRPGGLFIHSEWQFLESEKLKARIQPWESAGISPEAVDPQDYLLDWRSGGHGLRYVHHFNEEELQALAEKSRFRIRETFRSDGSNGRLSLYQLWEAL